MEIPVYTYWCLEKGYGRYAGPPDGTAAWRERARGWIQVMHKDIVLTAFVYTFVTLAFYFLGAAILHRVDSRADELEGIQAATALSSVFTRSFGQWSYYLFMLGAFTVLFATYTAAGAAWSRFNADVLSRLGFIRSSDEAVWNRWRRRTSIVLALIFLLAYWFVPTPVSLILLGGVLHAIFLPLLGLAVLFLWRQRAEADLRPGRSLQKLLLLCSLVTLGVVGASLALRFGEG